MLVLKRRTGVRVRLPDGRDVWVIVVGVEKMTHSSRPQVILGFDAPEDVLILREELDVNGEGDRP